MVGRSLTMDCVWSEWLLRKGALGLREPSAPLLATPTPTPVSMPGLVTTDMDLCFMALVIVVAGLAFGVVKEGACPPCREAKWKIYDKKNGFVCL